MNKDCSGTQAFCMIRLVTGLGSPRWPAEACGAVAGLCGVRRGLGAVGTASMGAMRPDGAAAIVGAVEMTRRTVSAGKGCHPLAALDRCRGMLRYGAASSPRRRHLQDHHPRRWRLRDN